MLKLFISISFASDKVSDVKGSCAPPGPSVLSHLIDNISTAEKNMCEPRVGVPVKVTSDSGPISRKFILTKTSENSYVAELNLNFVKTIYSIDVNGKVIDDGINYAAYVQSCLRRYEDYLKGPNGESLQIRLSSKAPEQEIAVGGYIKRSNSHEYGRDINCPIVLHEVLHLLGLRDEYKETSTGYLTDKTTGQVKFVEENAEIPAYDCRSTAPENSVMNDQFAALDSVLPSYEAESCVCTTEACIANMDRLILRGKKSEPCPKNTQMNKYGDCVFDDKIFSTASRAEVSDVFNNIIKRKIAILKKRKSCPKGTIRTKVNSISNEDGGGDGGGIMSLEVPKKILSNRKSILYPAQFRLITSPSCIFENSDYLICSNFAYESSQELPNKKCDPQAIKCQQNQDWLK